MDKKKDADTRYTEDELDLLREKQMEVALEGDRQMLIWLGKSVLGQAPASGRAGTDNAAEENVIVLTPDEAAALYGVKEEAGTAAAERSGGKKPKRSRRADDEA